MEQQVCGLCDGRVSETTSNSCSSRKPPTLLPNQMHVPVGCWTEALNMRERKALPGLDRVSIRMKIAFQKDILDHVTPWLKSLQKFPFLLAYRKNSSEPRLSRLHQLFQLSLPWGSYYALPSLSLPSMAPPVTGHLHKCFLLTEILLNVEVEEWEERQETQGLYKMRRIVGKTWRTDRCYFWTPN